MTARIFRFLGDAILAAFLDEMEHPHAPLSE